MATILDIGLLQSFDVVFSFLLVFAIVFTILQKTKLLGDAVGFNAIIAVVTGLLVLLSENVVKIINFIVPWFFVFALFMILLLLIFMIFGAKESDIFNYISNDKGVGWTIIGIAILIMVSAVGTVLGQSFTEQAFDAGDEGVQVDSEGGVATKSFDKNVTGTIFHPKVLGLITLMVIVIFAVGLLTGNLTPVGKH